MSNIISHPMSRLLPKKPEGPMRSPARVLGWFSICLGVAELAMPRTLARAAGMPNVPLLTRAYGVREIATGVGLLNSRNPAPWLWGRVAGDALDVATVGIGLVTARRPVRTLTSIAMLLGIAYIDSKTAQKAVPRQQRRQSTRDYSARSGFPKSPNEMRGIALKPSAPATSTPAKAPVAAYG